jgi:hypothetical protein
LVVGTKLDLVEALEKERQVDFQEANYYSHSINADYIEISSLAQKNLNQGLNRFLNKILLDLKIMDPEETLFTKEDSQFLEKSKSCC